MALGSVSCCQCCVVFVGWIQQVSFLVGLSFPFSETSKVTMAWELLFASYSEESSKAIQRVTSLVCWGYLSLNSMSFLKSAGLSIPPLLGVGHSAMHRGCLKSPNTFFELFVMCSFPSVSRAIWQPDDVYDEYFGFRLGLLLSPQGFSRRLQDVLQI